MEPQHSGMDSIVKYIKDNPLSASAASILAFGSLTALVNTFSPENSQFLSNVDRDSAGIIEASLGLIETYTPILLPLAKSIAYNKAASLMVGVAAYLGIRLIHETEQKREIESMLDDSYKERLTLKQEVLNAKIEGIQKVIDAHPSLKTENDSLKKENGSLDQKNDSLRKENSSLKKTLAEIVVNIACEEDTSVKIVVDACKALSPYESYIRQYCKSNSIEYDPEESIRKIKTIKEQADAAFTEIRSLAGSGNIAEAHKHLQKIPDNVYCRLLKSTLLHQFPALKEALTRPSSDSQPAHSLDLQKDKEQSMVDDIFASVNRHPSA